jgi:hypothetical protein
MLEVLPLESNMKNKGTRYLTYGLSESFLILDQSTFISDVYDY